MSRAFVERKNMSAERATLDAVLPRCTFGFCVVGLLHRLCQQLRCCFPHGEHFFCLPSVPPAQSPNSTLCHPLERNGNRGLIMEATPLEGHVVGKAHTSRKPPQWKGRCSLRCSDSLSSQLVASILYNICNIPTICLTFGIF